MIFDKTLMFWDNELYNSSSKILNLSKQVGDGQAVCVWINGDDDIATASNGASFNFRQGTADAASDPRVNTDLTDAETIVTLSGISKDQLQKGVKLTVPIRATGPYYALTVSSVSAGKITAGIVFDGQEAY